MSILQKEKQKEDEKGQKKKILKVEGVKEKKKKREKKGQKKISFQTFKPLVYLNIAAWKVSISFFGVVEKRNYKREREKKEREKEKRGKDKG